MADSYPRENITGVVLAGGRATRMGGEDKGLVELAGRPMVSYVLDCLRPQVGTVIVNANRNLEAYRRLCGCEVVPDRVGDFAGPLAGMASAMRRAETRFILTVPCDSPLICDRLGERLYRRLLDEDAELSVAHDGERLQPVFALIDCGLAADLAAYLASGGRKIDTWYATHRMAQADLSDYPDTFLNINSPDERTHLEQHLSGSP